MKPTTEVRPARTLKGPALIAAILALMLWAAFVTVMVVHADSANEVYWARLAFLFASVEAVAFAAGGAMWGSSIQRERAEKAEASAAANQEDAANGRALASTILADEEAQALQSTPGQPQRLGGQSSDSLKRYAVLARNLFPDR